MSTQSSSHAHTLRVEVTKGVITEPRRHEATWSGHVLFGVRRSLPRRERELLLQSSIALLLLPASAWPVKSVRNSYKVKKKLFRLLYIYIYLFCVVLYIFYRLEEKDKESWLIKKEMRKNKFGVLVKGVKNLNMMV